MLRLSEDKRANLIRDAELAALNAYAPYSHFRVGAVIVGDHGVYSGTNIENASFGLSLCAERAALAKAIAAGDRKIKAIAVACIDAPHGSIQSSFMPCGACRQWIAELAPEAVIILARVPGEYSIEDLLPVPFRL